MKVTDTGHEKKLDDAKATLESVALLETVAAQRQAKAQTLMASLTEEGLEPSELADRLDISQESTEALLKRDRPRPPHERMDVSEETIRKLDPPPPSRG